MDVPPLVDEAIRHADVSNPKQSSRDGSHEEALQSEVHGASVFDGLDAPDAAGSDGGDMDRGIDAPQQRGQRRTAARASPAILSAPVQDLARATDREVYPGAHRKGALPGHHNGNPVGIRSTPEILLDDSPRRGIEMIFPLVNAPYSSLSQRERNEQLSQKKRRNHRDCRRCQPSLHPLQPNDIG